MMNSKHLLNSNYPSNVFETYFLKDFRVCPEEISFLKDGYKYLKAGNRLVSLNEVTYDDTYAYLASKYPFIPDWPQNMVCPEEKPLPEGWKQVPEGWKHVG